MSRPPIQLSTVFASALLLLAAGCDTPDGKGSIDVVQDTVATPPELQVVETVLDRETVAAGQTVQVTCNGYDQYGDAFAANLGFEVLGGDGSRDPAGVTIAGDAVTLTNAGSYRILCVFGGPPRIEDTSPVLVTVEADAAVSVQTRLFIDQVVAGDSVSVTCTASDANGNAAATETVVRVTPDHGGVTVNGTVVRFTATGTYDVECETADGAIKGGDPHTVTVVPAALSRLRTTLTPDTITPDQPVTVGCQAEDAFGNAIDLALVFTLPVEGVTFLDDTRLKLTATRTGTYGISCTPKEAWVTAIEVPATLTVVAGAPTTLTLDVSPQRQVYSVGARVTATARISDAWGNPIPDLGDGLEIEARLAGSLRQTVPSGDKVTFDDEGVWTLRVATGAPHDLVATASCTADSSAPSIEVTYPARGQMISSSGGQLTVTGAIRDSAGGLAEVRINGAAQPLTPGTNVYQLDYRVSPRHGMNTLTIEATDTNGAVTRHAQSYLVAPAYKPTKTRFDQGIVAHLARDFLDDGVRGGDVDDLSTVFERVVNGIDVEALIPRPVVQYAGYDVYIEDVAYDPLTVALAPSSGVLELKLRIANLYAHIDADGFIDADGDVTVNAIVVTMQLNVGLVNGRPRVTERATVVDVQGLRIDVHWSINWIIGLFSNTIRDEISGAFADIIRQEVPPALEGALGALELDETFAIPAFLPGMQPLSLSLTGVPTKIGVTVDGLDLDLGTKVDAVKRVPWSAPGSLLRGGCFGADAERATFTADRRIGFALSTDVLNQILFHVWWGGGLEISLTAADLGGADLSEYGISELDMTLSGRMPPILTDCLDDQLRIQLGELQIDVSLTLGGLPVDLGLIVAFETTADITVDDDGVLGLELGAIAPEDILIDVTSIESDIFTPDQEDVIVSLLREQLLSTLLEDLAGQSLASFPLPEIDLGALAPELQGQVLSIGDVTLVRDSGFVVLQGDP